MTNVLMIVFTGIIAAATVVYTLVTFRLWKATKKSADAATAAAHAAKLSADAAKKSADIDAGVHRPYLGVSVFQRHNNFDADMWAIRWCVKNYGTLPASEVRVELAVGQRAGEVNYGGGPVCDHSEVLPQAELAGFLPIGIEARTRALLSGGEPMIAQVKVTYLSPDGTRYTHTARFPYDRTTQNFRVDGSETEEGRG